MYSTPLRYPGGKTKVMKFINKFIPPFEEYREPFLGGGSILYFIRNKFPGKIYKVSDINKELFIFWKECKENPIELIKLIYEMSNEIKDGRTLNNNARNRLYQSDYKYKSTTEMARDYFIINRTSFSGLGVSGGYSENSFQTLFGDRFTIRISDASNIFSEVEIYNESYEFLINMESERDVFILCDPPYYKVISDRLYGKNGEFHKNFIHEEFKNIITQSKYKWLITYDNSEYIRDLYSDYYQLEWETNYSMGHYNKRGKELLIANYPLEQQTKNIFFKK